MKTINLSRLILQFVSYISSYCVFNQHILALQKHNVKFHLRKYYDHSYDEYTSLGTPKRTHCLNPMRYHDASVENTYCYQFSSIVTQSIRNIWLTYDLTCRSKPLLTLVQTQYFLKVERQYNEAAWWSHNYLIVLSYDSS